MTANIWPRKKGEGKKKTVKIYAFCGASVTNGKFFTLSLWWLAGEKIQFWSERGKFCRFAKPEESKSIDRTGKRRTNKDDPSPNRTFSIFRLKIVALFFLALNLAIV